MSATATDVGRATALTEARAEALGLITRKRRIAVAVPFVILAYLAYTAIAFDLAGLAGRMRVDNAVTFASDLWSYKTHVTRDNRTDTVEIAIEGERKGAYPEGTSPDWVRTTATGTDIDLGGGQTIVFLPDTAVRLIMPDLPPIEARLVEGAVVTNLDTVFPGGVPGWINLSDSRLAITTSEGRLTFTRSRTEVFRYFGGWELFWFTLDSPYHGQSLPALVSGPRLDPDRSNLAGMWEDFWTNRMWRHADVAWAIFETVLMAFLGTFGGAALALPLSFLAARNFAPLGALRFAVRRVFDFLRGVDGLIWTIVLSRAFGPGPMTGALAILLTDTGSFGKIYSEALENVDERQIEGVRSTGADALQRARFGVIPQLVPVLLSQVLYLLESNTRSATIIGAITGGGIGLLLTQAMQTQKDWEEVGYYVALIVVMVMAMDTVSGWLRRRLIHGAT